MNHPLALVILGAQFAAALALFAGFLVPLAQGRIGVAAVEGVARQPEARGAITTTMFIGCGLSETNGVYGFVLAFLILFVNPLINNNIENLMRVVGY